MEGYCIPESLFEGDQKHWFGLYMNNKKAINQ